MTTVLWGLAAAAALVVAAFWVVRRRHRAPVVGDAPTTAPRRAALGARLAGVFGGGPGPGAWEAMEEALLAADVGVATSRSLVAAVQARRPADGAAARAALRSEMVAAFATSDRSVRLSAAPAIVVVVGVNGSGKTTTIAKLTSRWKSEGKRVLVGAADTFRAGATDQLRVWADRIGLEVVAGSPGADPAAVAHDALAAGRARGSDVVVIDTAGRLHDKRNLMDELAKIVRVLGRDGTAISEVLLVIDGTTGQNGLAQARAFVTAAGVTGVAVVKLDGTSRGGIALAIERELGVPIKLIGLGEAAGDLRDFVPELFVDSLLEGW